jgi:hypothetical protein
MIGFVRATGWRARIQATRFLYRFALVTLVILVILVVVVIVAAPLPSGKRARYPGQGASLRQVRRGLGGCPAESTSLAARYGWAKAWQSSGLAWHGIYGMVYNVRRGIVRARHPGLSAIPGASVFIEQLYRPAADPVTGWQGEGTGIARRALQREILLLERGAGPRSVVLASALVPSVYGRQVPRW